MLRAYPEVRSRARSETRYRDEVRAWKTGLWWWPGAVLPLVAFALLLGWLKILYYYAAFGVELGLLDLDAVDYLRESWFVWQNLAFFVLAWWVALAVRRIWVVAAALLYSLIPIAAHYAFAFEGAVASALIHHRHTLLKLIPFALLIVAWLVHGDRRGALRGHGLRFGRAAALLYVLVAASWAISAAKHFGSYDALRAMQAPDAYLSRVEIEGIAGEEGRWYLLAAGPDEVVLWRRPDAGAQADCVEVRVVPRESVPSLRLSRRRQVQPGGRYL